MKESDVVILVAEHDSTVVGYVYAALEPHNWKELRDPPAIHDVVVAESHQGRGINPALVEALLLSLYVR